MQLALKPKFGLRFGIKMRCSRVGIILRLFGPNTIFSLGVSPDLVEERTDRKRDDACKMSISIMVLVYLRDRRNLCINCIDLCIS